MLGNYDMSKNVWQIHCQRPQFYHIPGEYSLPKWCVFNQEYILVISNHYHVLSNVIDFDIFGLILSYHIIYDIMISYHIISVMISNKISNHINIDI